MERDNFGHFQTAYNEQSNTLRILINNSYLLNLTSSNMEEVLTTLEEVDYSTDIRSVVLNVQPMAPQEFVYGEDDEDDNPLIIGSNYSLYDNDIASFHDGETTELELSFDSVGDCFLLRNEILMHPATEWLLV